MQNLRFLQPSWLRFKSSCTWRRVDWYIAAAVSEERVASFIKVYAGHEDGGSNLFRNVSDFCNRQGISQKSWIWTKEPIAIPMRRYEGNIESCVAE
jgi:hypothetical protein